MSSSNNERLWECFVCGSAAACSHREPELLTWALKLARLADLTARIPARIPPGRELGAHSGGEAGRLLVRSEAMK